MGGTKIRRATIVMANDSDLLECVHINLNGEGTLRFAQLRALMSSPKLADYWVRNLDAKGLTFVGDSFLSEHSMLGDWDRKSYGVSMARWSEIQGGLEILDELKFHDEGVSRVQVWPFDPSELTLEAMKLAVAVSYSDLELFREPRIFGAINEMLSEYRIDAEPRC